MRRLAVVVAAAVVLATTGAEAARCRPRADVVADLAKRYGEQATWIGLSTAGHVVEVWANPETGTWTILTTAPAGPTCIQGAGEAAQALDPKPDVEEMDG